MAEPRSPSRSAVTQKAKEIRARFSDYEGAVTLVSSIEAWFRHEWGGSDGKPDLLQEFDRFPRLGGLTPDFCVRFRNSYTICGEHIKEFRQGVLGQKDTSQVLRYAAVDLGRGDGGTPVIGDVLLIVGTHTDEYAFQALAQARAAREGTCLRPVVVLGYYRDNERANGDWYCLKWRDQPGNMRFTTPNVHNDPGMADLNRDALDRRPHLAIKVTAPALDLAIRCPVINDPPPPIYSVVRLVIPALQEVISEEDRDTLAVSNRLTANVRRDDLLRAPSLAGMNVPAAYVKQGFDWLVEHGYARQLRGSNPPVYEISMSMDKLSGDLAEVLSEDEARRALRALRPSSRRAASRAKHPSGQMALDL